jgi:acyl CoA:acetate/3-ketoacid CoA transferase beta subunit
MEHVAKAKDGSEDPKLLKECSLPLTGASVVDLVITDLGVFSIDKKGGSGMNIAPAGAQTDLGAHPIESTTPAPQHSGRKLHLVALG